MNDSPAIISAEPVLTIGGSGRTAAFLRYRRVARIRERVARTIRSGLLHERPVHSYGRQLSRRAVARAARCGGRASSGKRGFQADRVPRARTRRLCGHVLVARTVQFADRRSRDVAYTCADRPIDVEEGLPVLVSGGDTVRAPRHIKRLARVDAFVLGSEAMNGAPRGTVTGLRARSRQRRYDRVRALDRRET